MLTSDMPAMTAGAHTQKDSLSHFQMIDRDFCTGSGNHRLDMLQIVLLAFFVSVGWCQWSDCIRPIGQLHVFSFFPLSRSKKSSKKRNRRADGNCEYLILIVSTRNVAGVVVMEFSRQVMWDLVETLAPPQPRILQAHARRA